MQFGFIFALIVSILIAIFAIQNGSEVTIDLFFSSFRVSQAVVILISTAVGAVVAAILGSFRQIKGFSATKEIKNKLKLMENEKSDLNKSVANYENDIQAYKSEVSSLKDQLAKAKTSYDEKCNEMNELMNKAIEDTAYLEENNEKGQAES